MLDNGPHPPRSREKKRNPWRQHVHRATRPRSYAIDKVWEAVTSRCLGNGRSNGSYKQYGGVKSIICYLCFMQHAWSCYLTKTSFLHEISDNSRRSGPGGGSIEICCRYLLDFLCYANQGSYKYLKKWITKEKITKQRGKNTKKYTDE